MKIQEQRLPLERGYVACTTGAGKEWFESRNPRGYTQGASAAGTAAGMNDYSTPQSACQKSLAQIDFNNLQNELRRAVRQSGVNTDLLDPSSVLHALCRSYSVAHREARALYQTWADLERWEYDMYPGIVEAVERMFGEPHIFEYGREPGDPEPPPCRWGHVLEDLAVQRFHQLTGLVVCEGGLWAMRHPDDPDRTRHYEWFRVSPDGLIPGMFDEVFDTGAGDKRTSEQIERERAVMTNVPGKFDFKWGLEIKCPVSGVKRMKKSTPDMVRRLHRWEGRSVRDGTFYIPIEYRMQMIYQAAVLGVDRIWFYMVKWRTRPDPRTGAAVDERAWAARDDFGHGSVEAEPEDEAVAVVYFTRSAWDWLFRYLDAMRACFYERRLPGWNNTMVQEFDPPPPLAIDYVSERQARGEALDEEALWRRHGEALERWRAETKRYAGMEKPSTMRLDKDYRMTTSVIC